MTIKTIKKKANKISNKIQIKIIKQTTSPITIVIMCREEFTINLWRILYKTQFFTRTVDTIQIWKIHKIQIIIIIITIIMKIWVFLLVKGISWVTTTKSLWTRATTEWINKRITMESQTPYCQQCSKMGKQIKSCISSFIKIAEILRKWLSHIKTTKTWIIIIAILIRICSTHLRKFSIITTKKSQ